MLTRRKLIMGAVATALVGLGATPALARDERLLADILYGVSDALVRDYIRDRYEDGRWTASRRRSPRSARSRIRIPATGTMTTMMTTTVAARTTVRRPRLHLTGDDGSRGARSWRTGPSGDFKKAATPTRSALPFSWPPVKRELRYGVRRARACGSRT